MNVFLIFYLSNISLLILHEIESAYEKEWEILHLPGEIQGFIILHIPILILLFYGSYEIQKQTQLGIIIGITIGICGIIPFIVHKLIVKRKDKFNKPLSNILIYGNIIIGITTAIIGFVNG